MNHLEAYKYLRDMGFRVHVSTQRGLDGPSYSVGAFLAEECRNHMAASVSCRVEAGRLSTAIISAARTIRQNIEALQECSEFVGEEFFKLTMQ